jgi:hypothetical protein
MQSTQLCKKPSAYSAAAHHAVRKHLIVHTLGTGVTACSDSKQMELQRQLRQLLETQCNMVLSLLQASVYYEALLGLAAAPAAASAPGWVAAQ